MGWESKKLEDVCRLINGRAYKKKEMLADGPYPLLRVGNFFTNREWYYSDLELDEDKYCDTGDLLYAWSASFGPRIWDGGKVIYHYHIWKIEIDQSKANKKYLFHLLDWDKERIKEEQGAGTTMVHVTKGSMEKRVLPFPPLSEQKRIVAILDKAFAAIDEAKAKTEQNLKNARELFDSYLQQLFSQRGEGWVEANLASVASISMGQSPKGSSYNSESVGVPLINGPVEFGPTAFSKTIRTKYTTEPTKMCKEGDLILCVRGSTTGRMNIAGFDACIGRGVASIRSEKYQDWINHYINFNREKIYELGSGATFPNVSGTALANFKVVIPPINKIASLISLIESLKSSTENLEAVYLRKIEMLDMLEKSLLQKAFSGDLTAKQAEEAVT